MNRRSLGVLLVAVIIVGGGVSYFVWTREAAPAPTTRGAASYSTTGAAGSSTTTECTISGMPAGVDIQVLTDAGSPVAGAEVSGQTVGDQCGDFRIPTTATNSTGSLGLEGVPGAYNLTVNYAGRNYDIGAPMYPISLTTIILKVPSGFWTLDVREGGLIGLAISGPSFVSNGTGSPRLNVTLGSSSVKQGDYLPIMVEFVGAGASSASDVHVNMTVTNSSGAVMFSISQAMPDLYLSTGATNLRGLYGCLGWDANYHTGNPTPVPVGTYMLTITAEVGGDTLQAIGSFQVTG